MCFDGINTNTICVCVCVCGEWVSFCLQTIVIIARFKSVALRQLTSGGLRRMVFQESIIYFVFIFFEIGTD